MQMFRSKKTNTEFVSVGKIKDWRDAGVLSRKKRRDPEHQEAVALMRWVELAKAAHPELALLYAIPNGGKRSKITAARLKAEGVRAGVPDYCLPVARGGYHALYVELKTLTGRPSREQIDYIRQLEGAGNMCCVAKGWDQAQRCIVDYLTPRA